MNRFRTARYANDQSTQPSLDTDSKNAEPSQVAVGERRRTSFRTLRGDGHQLVLLGRSHSQTSTLVYVDYPSVRGCARGKTTAEHGDDPQLLVALRRCLQVARDGGCQTIVIENRYVDADYRSEFSAYWSLKFAGRPGFTRRMHFFTADLEDDAIHTLPDNAGYLGYIVLRPVATGVVGRTVLAPPPQLAGEGKSRRSAVSANVGLDSAEQCRSTFLDDEVVVHDSVVGAGSENELHLASVLPPGGEQWILRQRGSRIVVATHDRR